MVAVLVVGTIIGLIWADTSNLAGGFAVVTNIGGVVGIVLLAMTFLDPPSAAASVTSARTPPVRRSPRKNG